MRVRRRTVILCIAGAAAIVLFDPLPPPGAPPSADPRRELIEARAVIERLRADLERAEFRIKYVRDPPAISTQPAQATKVTAADNATSVVTIGLGSEDGVEVGYRYTISRGTWYVGTVIITDVAAKQATGRSLKDIQKSPIRVGDDATSR